MSSLDPDSFAKGVLYWDEAESMDELMDFLVRYVRLVHCKSYFKSNLTLNEGNSYIDMLTANDIAYAICLLANGLESWRSKKANGGVADKDTKMRFSAGENMILNVAHRHGIKKGESISSRQRRHGSVPSDQEMKITRYCANTGRSGSKTRGRHSCSVVQRKE